MWSQRFPLKRWEFYQNMIYREIDDWSFVSVFFLLIHGSMNLLAFFRVPYCSQSPVSDVYFYW